MYAACHQKPSVNGTNYKPPQCDNTAPQSPTHGASLQRVSVTSHNKPSVAIKQLGECRHLTLVSATKQEKAKDNGQTLLPLPEGKKRQQYVSAPVGGMTTVVFVYPWRLTNFKKGKKK